MYRLSFATYSVTAVAMIFMNWTRIISACTCGRTSNPSATHRAIMTCGSKTNDHQDHKQENNKFHLWSGWVLCTEFFTLWLRLKLKFIINICWYLYKNSHHQRHLEFHQIGSMF